MNYLEIVNNLPSHGLDGIGFTINHLGFACRWDWKSIMLHYDHTSKSVYKLSDKCLERYLDTRFNADYFVLYDKSSYKFKIPLFMTKNLPHVLTFRLQVQTDMLPTILRVRNPLDFVNMMQLVSDYMGVKAFMYDRPDSLAHIFRHKSGASFDELFNQSDDCRPPINELFNTINSNLKAGVSLKKVELSVDGIGLAIEIGKHAYLIHETDKSVYKCDLDPDQLTPHVIKANIELSKVMEIKMKETAKFKTRKRKDTEEKCFKIKQFKDMLRAIEIIAEKEGKKPTLKLIAMRRRSELVEIEDILEDPVQKSINSAFETV